MPSAESPSAQAAQAALAEINAAMAQSSTLRAYQAMAPHLIIWGIIWAVGYSVTYLRPAASNLTWLCLVPVGSVASVIASQRDRGEKLPPIIWQLMAIYGLFSMATLAVMQPHDPSQAGAFFPLLISAAYAVLGCMGARRILVLGVVLAVLTLAGFFSLGALFPLYMAVVAGGGLVLGGFWLRRA